MPTVKRAFHRHPDREIDEQHALCGEDELAERVEARGQPAEPDLRIDRVGLELLPGALAIAFLPESLDGGDPAERFDEAAASLRGGGDRVDVAHPQRMQEGDLEAGVEQPGDERDAAEQRRVKEHQRERAERHHPVDDRGDEALAEQLRRSTGSSRSGEMMSPTCRFSNHGSGRRSMCRLRLLTIW